METCGIAKNTYLNAVNTLIEKGYLVQVELYPNLTGYLFIEEGLEPDVEFDATNLSIESSANGIGDMTIIAETVNRYKN
ncbi:MAG: hypothetical protein IKU15_03675, partial [Clostridia bacterium]|nr:hypothetical protein [Clostridia bacterium]